MPDGEGDWSWTSVISLIKGIIEIPKPVPFATPGVLIPGSNAATPLRRLGVTTVLTGFPLSQTHQQDYPES